MVEPIDVLVLGGGYGTRLYKDLNLSDYTPKGLISINNSSGLEIGLNTFSRSLINKILIETNNEGAHAYGNWIKDHPEYNAKLFVEPFSSPDSCLGILKTIEYTHKKLGFNCPMLLMAPDNIFFHNQDHLIENSKQADARILTYEVAELEKAKNYGVIQVKKDKIVDCEEKPENPRSRLVKTAYEIWNPRMFDALEEWNMVGNSDKIGDYIKYLIEKGFEIISVSSKGDWVDIGTKEDLINVRRNLR